MIPLVIYGSGGHAREVLALVQSINLVAVRFDVLGFVDDDPSKRGSILKGFAVVGLEEAVTWNAELEVVIAIGHTPTRFRIAQRLAELGIVSPTLVHPSASLGTDVILSTGSQVAAGVAITTDVRIGKHVILNQACTIAHDAILDDFVTLGPGVRVSGHVHVGEGSDVGTGTCIIQGIRIGEWSIVGASAAVVRDVAPNVTAVGVPAHVIKERPVDWHRARSGNLLK